MTPLRDHIDPIDENTLNISWKLLLFTLLSQNKRLPPVFGNHRISDINWTMTKSWIAITTELCGNFKSKLGAYKIKSLNHILLCSDILKFHYPNLYPN
ncbi:hypothetical protein RhiirC2_757632, partial [Rhizophagus irregularis]